MEKGSLNLLNGINRAIIKFRGLYSRWSNEHSISYHEMLVLYTIREHGFCTQKQICDSYLLPKQTINHVIKVFFLFEKGQEYAAPFLASLDTVKNRALGLLGKEKLQTLTGLLLE